MVGYVVEDQVGGGEGGSAWVKSADLRSAEA
jgi:hypothetical protein